MFERFASTVVYNAFYARWSRWQSRSGTPVGPLDMMIAGHATQTNYMTD